MNRWRSFDSTAIGMGPRWMRSSISNPKVSRGGYVIVDDYGSWPSCRRAVTEYLERNGLKPEIRPVDWSAVYWQAGRAGTAGGGRHDRQR